MIFMKKIGIILLSVIMVFSMAACNGGKGKTDNQTEKQAEGIKSTEVVKETTEAVTEATTEVVAEETSEAATEIQSDAGETDIDDKQPADTKQTSKTEEQPKADVEQEPKTQADDNKDSRDNQNDTGSNNPGTDTPKANESNPQPASVAYSPQNVVALATAKCQAGGMITTQQNLQNHLNDGSITQEEYNEYYPYDGMEGSYYSVFVETDLNKASTIDGQRLSSEDAIAGYIASMLLLETDPVFYISYDGIYTTGGTDYYEFRCHR